MVPGIPGAHTPGAGPDELSANLKEVLELCLQEFPGAPEDLRYLVGLEQVDVAL